MSNSVSILIKLYLLLLAGLITVNGIAAEEPTVSRSVHSKLIKTQEKIDDKNYTGALKTLNSLKRKSLSDFERQNVLSYLGYVNYMLEDLPAAMDAYEDLLRIKNIDEVVRKQTTYTVAQLATGEKDYKKAAKRLNEWFKLEPDPLPENYVLYAHNLLKLQRYSEMISPMESAFATATDRGMEIKASWHEMLNFAYLELAEDMIEKQQYYKAMSTLQDLKASSNLTDQERLNVLTKTGFVHELMGNTDAAIAVYGETLLAPGLDDRGRQQISARVTRLRTPVVAAGTDTADTPLVAGEADATDTLEVTAEADATDTLEVTAESDGATTPVVVANIEIIKTTPIRLIEERYALVIGNGKYQTIDPLDNPANDVRLVTDALESAGFEVTTLVDADGSSMDEAVNAFANDLHSAGENAVGIFYYAGHGVSYQGQNYLIPVGANIQQATHLKYRAVSANMVLGLMEEARNATDIVILDSCRNSPFRSFSLSRTRSAAQGLSRMDIAPSGSFIVYSTSPGKVAYDGRGNYSAFAEAFAYEVETTSESIGDMMIDVRVKVRDATEHEEQGAQIPWANSSLLGKFWFNPGRPGGDASARTLVGD